MIDPVYLESDDLLVHPFRPQDLDRYEQLTGEVFAILSDKETLVYLPEKKLKSLAEGENWLKVAILDHHAGRNHMHFISEKSTGKLLGMIDIITPLKARQYYRLPGYPHFIEFYLHSSAWGKSIMSNLLPWLVRQLQAQGIYKIGAVVNKRNRAAGRVLNKAGFTVHAAFDHAQDLYELKTA